MKKILSLGLAGVMAMSAIPMAYATNVYENPGADTEMGTQVVYEATGAEAYTVTVPAQLAPEGSGDVYVEGTWATDRKLVVTADTSVELTNSISKGDTKTLTVSFPGIALKGDNTVAITQNTEGAKKTVSVADIKNALFGTWSGTFYYNVEMVDVDNVELITFTIDGVEYQAEEGMTWGTWVNSDYNTGRFKLQPDSNNALINYDGRFVVGGDNEYGYRLYDNQEVKSESYIVGNED